MAELLATMVADRGDAIALVDETGERTWAELDDRVNRLVSALRARGLGVGDTIAVLSGNRRELVEVFLAAMHGGWVVVPVNWHWTSDELAYVLGDCGARALLVDDRFVDIAAGAREDERSVAVEHWIAMGGRPGFDAYEEVLAQGDPGDPADQCTGGPMFYTSGTTGFPKGVRSMLSATGHPVALWQLISGGMSTNLGVPERGVTLLDGPAYHSAQWVFSMFPLLAGSTLVMQHRFDPATTLELIDRHGVTNLHLVPTQFIRLLRLPDDVRGRFDGASLQAVFHGAAPCSADVKRSMLAWWGPVVHEYYGGTEGGFLSIIRGDEWLDHEGSLGRAFPTAELMVVDEDGNEVPAGTTGQIYFRSKLGADFSYHGDDEKTRAAHLADGWGTLGDVGHLDDEGFLFLSDRKIDMIISGGVNIYPAEIEGVLVNHPRVADAAVFGIPDDEMGEQVRAAVELVDGVAADEDPEALVEELRELVRSRLAGYKVPKVVDIVDALPRHPTGKLFKRLLRDPYWEGTGRSL